MNPIAQCGHRHHVERRAKDCARRGPNPDRHRPWLAERRRRLVDQFWDSTDRSGECWVWLGKRDRKGYGRIRRNWRDLLAHRYAYELSVGPIPEGLLVLHICDNPPCVNPDHLFAGTAADNTRDMIAKGRARHPVGEAHQFALLTEAIVREIRTHRGRYQRGELTALAQRLGVAPETIQSARKGVTWKHVR